MARGDTDESGYVSMASDGGSFPWSVVPNTEDQNYQEQSFATFRRGERVHDCLQHVLKFVFRAGDARTGPPEMEGVNDCSKDRVL